MNHVSRLILASVAQLIACKSVQAQPQTLPTSGPATTTSATNAPSSNVAQPPVPAAAAPVLTTAPPAPLPALAAVRTFQFTAQTAKVLPGNSAAPDGKCKGVIDPADQLGNAAVAATFFQNACYTDGQYNAREFAVEQGTVTVSDGASFEAYRFAPAKLAAKNFLASHHMVFLRFTSAQAHTLYTLEGDTVAVVGTVPASSIVPDAFTALPVDVSTLGAARTLFVAPSNAPVTALTRLGPLVQGAALPANALGSVALYRHTVAGAPFDTRAQGGGIDARIERRRYFPMTLGQQPAATATRRVFGITWQDTVDASVRITIIAHDQLSQREIVVDNPNRDTLAAAASDGGNNVYMFMVQAPSKGALTTRATRLVRVDIASNEQTELAADASKAGLNITNFTDVASMQFDQGRLLLMIGRTMHRSSDGLNHQGGIAVEFDPRTLAIIKNFGQTSGHSFDNVLVPTGNGEFAGLDLGDNYPRGIHLHRFGMQPAAPGTATSPPQLAARTWHSALVYTFKTFHGTTPQSPAGVTYPAYPEISGAQNFFQWSNDNGVYTELGGVVPTPTGYVVVFAGEAAANKALDNSRVGDGVADSRNLAVVQLRRDFEQLPRYGSVIPDDAILTKAPSETGGFFSFGGTWTAQRNTGVIWLTRYNDPAKQNAAHIRAVPLPDGNILVLWEQWTRTAYLTTFGAKITPTGRLLTPATDLGPTLRISARDDLLVDGANIYIITGRPADHAIDVAVLNAK